MEGLLALGFFPSTLWAFPREYFILYFQDPREALILSLKREVTVLQSENEQLRSALHMHTESSGENFLGLLILIFLIHKFVIYSNLGNNNKY